VSDLMRRDVVTISPGATVQELARLLRTHRISGVPVVDESGLAVGVVSVTDLLWLSDHLLPAPVAVRPARRWEGIGKRTVRDIMTEGVFGVTPESDLEDLLEFFSGTGLHRAFVVRDGKVLGVISMTDLLELVEEDEAPAG
jgi:CBS domain-containing protein